MRAERSSGGIRYQWQAVLLERLPRPGYHQDQEGLSARKDVLLNASKVEKRIKMSDNNFTVETTTTPVFNIYQQGHKQGRQEVIEELLEWCEMLAKEINNSKPKNASIEARLIMKGTLNALETELPNKLKEMKK